MLDRIIIGLLALIGAATLVLWVIMCWRIFRFDIGLTHTANQVGIPERPVAGRARQVASLEP